MKRLATLFLLVSATTLLAGCSLFSSEKTVTPDEVVGSSSQEAPRADDLNTEKPDDSYVPKRDGEGKEISRTEVQWDQFPGLKEKIDFLTSSSECKALLELKGDFVSNQNSKISMYFDEALKLAGC